MPTVAAFPSTSAYSWLCVNFHVEAHRNDDEAAGAGRGSGFRDTGSGCSGGESVIAGGGRGPPSVYERATERVSRTAALTPPQRLAASIIILEVDSES